MLTVAYLGTPAALGIGVLVGALCGVPIGRLSVRLEDWVTDLGEKRRQLVRRRTQVTRAAAELQAEDAGQYPWAGMRAGVTQQEPPGNGARLRGTRLAVTNGNVNSAGPN